jgi:RNA exonuclease 1
MFSAKGLFKNIPCPVGMACNLPTCIFSHEQQTQKAEPSLRKEEDVNSGGDRKRVKFSNGTATPVLGQKTPEPRKPFVGILAQASSPAKSSPVSDRSGSVGSATLKSLARQISPPRVKASLKKSGSGPKALPALPHDLSVAVGPKEDLNPRLVGNGSNSASHNIRLALLRMLHQQMQRLDTGVRSSSDPTMSKWAIHPDNLVWLALDEEQKIAKSSGPNYRVTMGHYMVDYRKKTVEQWCKELESRTAPPEEPELPVPFSTDLDFHLERRLLNRYIANQDGLEKYGYVLEKPTDESIAKTQEAMVKCDFWETCDRCGTRFQVFHNRREDGALTSGSACKHHWGRAYMNKDTREKTYSCCGAVVGSPGCSVHDTHVFLTKDVTRLAKALQFEFTPENDGVDPSLAVSFDCEMGYTTIGMEMLRISATTWPDNKTLMDTLVRPIGHVLDLNTRFSGVTSDQFLNAQEYNPPLDGTFTQEAMLAAMKPGAEPILPSTEIARAILFSLISPKTPLIGHSIDNDLNVMRIIHPTLVDTVILYPFPQGLPYRYGLKRLTKDYLHRDIQNAGADGHDSLEDSRATGDLVRAKMSAEWIKLKSLGWKIEEINGAKRFVAPEGDWDVTEKRFMIHKGWWKTDDELAKMDVEKD